MDGVAGSVVGNGVDCSLEVGATVTGGLDGDDVGVIGSAGAANWWSDGKG